MKIALKRSARWWRRDAIHVATLFLAVLLQVSG